MKDLYYTTKIDRDGNKLTVAYTTAKIREKYGKDGAHEDTVIFADFDQEGRLALTNKHKHEVRGVPLRAMLVNNGNVAASEGQYVLYGKTNNKWARTQFSFDNFGAANTAMKGMISSYQAMLVVDTGAQATSSEAIYDLEIGE